MLKAERQQVKQLMMVMGMMMSRENSLDRRSVFFVAVIILFC
jgi:hypothetical protein